MQSSQIGIFRKSFSRRKCLFQTLTLKRTLVQGNYYHKICLLIRTTCNTRLVTHSTRLTTRSTRLPTLSTRLSTRSTCLSTLNTPLSIRSTRLSTRSICLSHLLYPQYYLSIFLKLIDSARGFNQKKQIDGCLNRTMLKQIYMG